MKRVPASLKAALKKALPSKSVAAAVALAALAVLVRVDWNHNTGLGPSGDFLDYLRISGNVIQKGFYGVRDEPDHKFPPGYPLLLAAYSSLVDGGTLSQVSYYTLNLILDAVTMILLVLVGMRVCGGRALPGLFLAAINPCWFSGSNVALSESLSVTLFAGFLWFWLVPERRRAHLVAAGVLLGALALTRSMYLWLAPVVALADRFVLPLLMPRAARPGGARAARRETWNMVVFLVAAYSLPLAWGGRNLAVFGRLGIGQSENGIKMAYAFIHVPDLDFKVEASRNKFFSLPLMEKFQPLEYGDPKAAAGVIAEMKAEVLAQMREHPFRYLGSVLANPFRLWISGWGNPFGYIYVPAYLGVVFRWGFALPVVLLGLIGLVRHLFDLRAAKHAGPEAAARGRAAVTQAVLVLFVTGITAPLLVESRYCLIPFVIFSIWMGYAFKSRTDAAKA